MSEFAPTAREGESVRRTHWGNWVWTARCGFEATCLEDVGGHRAECARCSESGFGECPHCGEEVGDPAKGGVYRQGRYYHRRCSYESAGTLHTQPDLPAPTGCDCGGTDGGDNHAAWCASRPSPLPSNVDAVTADYWHRAYHDMAERAMKAERQVDAMDVQADALIAERDALLHEGKTAAQAIKDWYDRAMELEAERDALRRVEIHLTNECKDLRTERAALRKEAATYQRQAQALRAALQNLVQTPRDMTRQQAYQNAARALEGADNGQ